MQVNRQQACGIFGLSRAEFDRLLPLGLPAHKKSSSRGQDWTIDTLAMHEFLVEQAVAKRRPRSRSATPDFSNPPPGWEALKSCEQVEEPLERVGMLTVLCLIYSVPRLVANLGGDCGLTMTQMHKMSVGMVLLLMEHCRATFDFWPKGDDAVPLLERAFSSINWPFLAVQAGEPKWRPPIYGVGWGPVTPQEHRDAVEHGREAERQYAEMERDAAARADA